MKISNQQNATEELERLERAFDDVKTALFRRLHGALRSEVFADCASEVRREGASDSVSFARGASAAAASFSRSEDEEEEDEEEEAEAEAASHQGNGAAAASAAVTTAKAAGNGKAAAAK